MTALGLHPWIGIALVVVGLLGMLGALRYLQQRLGWQPETLRKLAHVGTGFAALSYPLLFRDQWPVLMLGALALGTMAMLRWIPWMRNRVGTLVHGVDRASVGELYFPIAVTTLFLLANGNVMLYFIPILTLTVADAVAAVIGLAYGRKQFGDVDSRKSIEGSIAFFLVAFLASHVPLLLLTDIGRAESLLIGLTMGVLLMLLEAVSWRGLDNLFVPLGAFLLLRTFVTLDAPALGARLLVTMLLLAFVLLMRRFKSLGDNAMLAGVLVGYVAWSAGGWKWLFPPLILFVLYNIVFPRSDQVRNHPHRMLAIFSVTATGLAWLLLASVLLRWDFYYPYTVAFAMSLCSYGITWYRDYRRTAGVLEYAVVPAVVSWLAFFVPYYSLVHTQPLALTVSVAALAPLLLGSFLQVVFVPHVRHRSSAEFPWSRQVAISAVASITAYWIHVWLSTRIMGGS